MLRNMRSYVAERKRGLVHFVIVCTVAVVSGLAAVVNGHVAPLSGFAAVAAGLTVTLSAQPGQPAANAVCAQVCVVAVLAATVGDQDRTVIIVNLFTRMLLFCSFQSHFW